jgi:acetyl esterase/lipase
MSDWLCSNVAAAVGAVVVSVDYRLAPTNRFPAAVDDCYAALTWAADHAGAGGPIGVMGESAGGNLSAVVCLLARDRGGPALSRADGVAYAEALRAAGVPVRLTEYVGMPHGYLNFPGLCRLAPQALAEITAEQRAALVQPSATVG